MSRGTDPWRTQLRKVPTESRDPDVFVEVPAVRAVRVRPQPFLEVEER